MEELSGAFARRRTDTLKWILELLLLLFIGPELQPRPTLFLFENENCFNELLYLQSVSHTRSFCMSQVSAPPS